MRHRGGGGSSSNQKQYARSSSNHSSSPSPQAADSSSETNIPYSKSPGHSPSRPIYHQSSAPPPAAEGGSISPATPIMANTRIIHSASSGGGSYGYNSHHRAPADDADIAAGATAIELLALPQGGGGGGTAGGGPGPTSPYHHHYPDLVEMNNEDYSRQKFTNSIESAPTSLSSTFSINSTSGRSGGDLEFFEDMVSEPVLVLGMDITHLSRRVQFLICATGVFCFSLLYGYLQELISVQLCNRKLGLFLAQVQFSGYTLLAYVLRSFVYEREKKQRKGNRNVPVPLLLYLGLSLLRAIDLGMTNLAMQYINYPAKTLMKSSRVVFTMLFGVIISRKKYKLTDYLIVFAMVTGLAIFMHADSNSSAVFHVLGVIMLVISLICDGAISNMSESIMSQFGVGQDEFIFRMYSISLVAITLAAIYKGDMKEGMAWLSQPGTYDELALPISERTWSVPGKIACIALFSSMGFFGSSCAAAITKQFGALTMSITSTARKATTLFLSFLLFKNVCTTEHVMGMVIFISALTAKSLRRRKDKHPSKDKHNKKHRHRHRHHRRKHEQQKQEELQPFIDSTIEIPASGGESNSSLIHRTASRESGTAASADSIDDDNNDRDGAPMQVMERGYHRSVHIV